MTEFGVVGEEETGEGKEKSPQGYDEDNASLDKFCKIKAKKEKHKVDQLQKRKLGGRGRFHGSRRPGSVLSKDARDSK